MDGEQLAEFEKTVCTSPPGPLGGNRNHFIVHRSTDISKSAILNILKSANRAVRTGQVKLDDSKHFYLWKRLEIS